MRSFLRSVLPALAFFGLLAAAAGIGFWFGRQSAAAATASDKVYTCSMHPQIRMNEPGLCPICHMELVPLDSVPASEGKAITIEPVVVQNMGVRVATVTRGPLVRTVRAFGVLQAAESRQRDVALKVSGFVEKLYADTLGMAIKKGEPLFELYSADLVIAQEELIAAKKSGDQDLLAAARQKLALWDVPDAVIDELEQREHAARTLVWKSPADGVLVQKDVVAGAPAMMNQTLLRIADLSELWLDAQVPEHQLAALKVGQRATAELAAAPGTTLPADVIFVAPTLDESTRTAVVRAAVPNRDGAWKPGMFARLLLAYEVAADAVQVPAEAVIDTGERRVVWLASGGGRFEPRDVELGALGDGGLREVRSGLAAGERVVVSGQFLIDAESNLREGTRKMSGQGLMPGGKDLPLPEPLRLSEQHQRLVDELLRAYFAVTAGLFDDRDDDAAWQAFVAAARALHDDAPAEVHEPLHALQQALAAEAADAPARRQALIAAGKPIVALVERARPSASFGEQLHVVHCPMVVADWLQPDAGVRNFFDLSMKACGEVLRTIPTGGSK